MSVRSVAVLPCEKEKKKEVDELEKGKTEKGRNNNIEININYYEEPGHHKEPGAVSFLRNPRRLPPASLQRRCAKSLGEPGPQLKVKPRCRLVLAANKPKNKRSRKILQKVKKKRGAGPVVFRRWLRSGVS